MQKFEGGKFPQIQRNQYILTFTQKIIEEFSKFRRAVLMQIAQFEKNAQPSLEAANYLRDTLLSFYQQFREKGTSIYLEFHTASLTCREECCNPSPHAASMPTMLRTSIGLHNQHGTDHMSPTRPFVTEYHTLLWLTRAEGDVASSLIYQHQRYYFKPLEKIMDTLARSSSLKEIMQIKPHKMSYPIFKESNEFYTFLRQNCLSQDKLQIEAGIRARFQQLGIRKQSIANPYLPFFPQQQLPTSVIPHLQVSRGKRKMNQMDNTAQPSNKRLCDK